MKKKMQSDFTLLNFEGPVLKAKRIIDPETFTTQFVVYDQWDDLVGILTRDKLFEFLDGKNELIDSKGKVWNYSKEHKDAKPSWSKLYEFVKPHLI